VLGPYILGSAAVFPDLRWDLVPWRFWLFLVFFGFPANLFVYGVNDVFDYATDKENPKKQGYEALVLPSEHPAIWLAICICLLPFLIGSFGAPRMFLIGLAGFMFFSWSYSAPPLRTKTRPFLDSVWNVLYVFPGICALSLLSPQAPFPLPAFSAAWIWCMAMHAYSAVPDIASDRAAGIATIATHLGRQATLWSCLACHVAAGVLAYLAGLGMVGLGLGSVYVGLMAVSLRTRTDEALMAYYRRFPLVNTVCGAILCLALFMS
jgi:4-hydroxybenzoate polyprenyltransferase